MVAGIPQWKVNPKEFQRYAKLTYFGDQRVDARYVSHVWKVGFWVWAWNGEGEDWRKNCKKTNRGQKGGDEADSNGLEAEVWNEHKRCDGGFSSNSLNGLVEFIMSCCWLPTLISLC